MNDGEEPEVQPDEDDSDHDEEQDHTIGTEP
jgi:hypothetical protein